MSTGIIPKLVVVLLVVFGINWFVLSSLAERSYSDLALFGGLPWILVPAMAIHSGYTALHGVFFAIVWDIFLLWPTAVVVSVFVLYNSAQKLREKGLGLLAEHTNKI